MLRKYAKDAIIEKTVVDLDSTQQREEEDETSFATRLQDKARACGNVYSESQLITKFMRGIGPDVKPHLWGLRQKQPGISSDELVEAAQALGSANRALLTRFSQPKPRPAKLERHPKVLHIQTPNVTFEDSIPVAPPGRQTRIPSWLSDKTIFTSPRPPPTRHRRSVTRLLHRIILII